MQYIVQCGGAAHPTSGARHPGLPLYKCEKSERPEHPRTREVIYDCGDVVRCPQQGGGQDTGPAVSLVGTHQYPVSADWDGARYRLGWCQILAPGEKEVTADWPTITGSRCRQFPGPTRRGE